jgi:hydroxyacylglutathione hydrolase
LPSNMGLELLINPFLRTDTETVKKYALNHGAASADSLNVFETVRNQKNIF